MKNVFRTAGLVSMLLGGVAQAQQPGKIPRIGFQLDANASAVAARVEGFRHELRELGYFEGKNIIIEWRSAEGKLDRRSQIAGELVGLKVDVLVSAGPAATLALRQATSNIPIVMPRIPIPWAVGSCTAWQNPVETSLVCPLWHQK